MARINQKKLKKLLTEEMKFSILNKLLFEAANISKGFEKSLKNPLTNGKKSDIIIERPKRGSKKIPLLGKSGSRIKG